MSVVASILQAGALKINDQEALSTCQLPLCRSLGKYFAEFLLPEQHLTSLTPYTVPVLAIGATHLMVGLLRRLDSHRVARLFSWMGSRYHEIYSHRRYNGHKDLSQHHDHMEHVRMYGPGVHIAFLHSPLPRQ